MAKFSYSARKKALDNILLAIKELTDSNLYTTAWNILLYIKRKFKSQIALSTGRIRLFLKELEKKGKVKSFCAYLNKKYTTLWVIP